jgi:hypothetical protein
MFLRFYGDVCETAFKKYQNVGIKVARIAVLRKNAIMYFDADRFFEQIHKF